MCVYLPQCSPFVDFNPDIHQLLPIQPGAFWLKTENSVGITRKSKQLSADLSFLYKDTLSR